MHLTRIHPCKFFEAKLQRSPLFPNQRKFGCGRGARLHRTRPFEPCPLRGFSAGAVAASLSEARRYGRLYVPMRHTRRQCGIFANSCCARSTPFFEECISFLTGSHNAQSKSRRIWAMRILVSLEEALVLSCALGDRDSFARVTQELPEPPKPTRRAITRIGR
jgi:hypothetical protein